LLLLGAESAVDSEAVAALQARIGDVVMITYDKDEYWPAMIKDRACCMDTLARKNAKRYAATKVLVQYFEGPAHDQKYGVKPLK
jgi:hypothetical protein